MQARRLREKQLRRRRAREVSEVVYALRAKKDVSLDRVYAVISGDDVTREQDRQEGLQEVLEQSRRRVIQQRMRERRQGSGEG